MALHTKLRVFYSHYQIGASNQAHILIEILQILMKIF